MEEVNREYGIHCESVNWSEKDIRTREKGGLCGLTYFLC